MAFQNNREIIFGRRKSNGISKLTVNQRRKPRNQLDVAYVLNEIEKGRTQKDIADELGVSQGHVQKEITRI